MTYSTYLAGPITEDRVERQDWREDTRDELLEEGIEALLPYPAQAYSDTYGGLSGNANMVLTIRDNRYTTQCDVVLANFEYSDKASIGTAIEFGWASEAGVPIVAAIPRGNIHEHPMILSLVTVRTYTLRDAIDVVKALGGSKIGNWREIGGAVLV